MLCETSLEKARRVPPLFSSISRHQRLLGAQASHSMVTGKRFCPQTETPRNASHLQCKEAPGAELIAASKVELKVRRSSGHYYFWGFSRMSSSEIKRASHCENKCFREKRNISHQGVRNRWPWRSCHASPKRQGCSLGPEPQDRDPGHSFRPPPPTEG